MQSFVLTPVKSPRTKAFGTLRRLGATVSDGFASRRRAANADLAFTALEAREVATETLAGQRSSGNPKRSDPKRAGAVQTATARSQIRPETR